MRDRALLCFGMACCLRRFELVALEVADLERIPKEQRNALHLARRHLLRRSRIRGAMDCRELFPAHAFEYAYVQLYIDLRLTRSGRAVQR